jgi:predicted transglutaminase-like cysteine proteinase
MRRSPRFGDVKMLPRVAAVCFAAFVIVWPVRSGLDSGTLDEFSPAAAALAPADNRVADAARAEPEAKSETNSAAQIQPATHDDAPARTAALEPVQPDVAPPPVAEPFGLSTIPIAYGGVFEKWSGVEAGIHAENEVLARCRDDIAHCPAAARSFLDIVAEGRAQTGRARIGVINRAVNMAIQPARDPAHWRAPLDTLSLGRGDCKDYAIAKYVALTAAGVAAQDVKLVIVRNLAAGEDHAVVAVRDEGNWIVLDNRWLTLVEDVDMPKVIPLFVLDDAGVRVFAPTLSATHQASAPASL